MLAEFKYGLEPKESFASFLGDQAIPRAAYYYLKKDFFPWTYWNFMVRVIPIHGLLLHDLVPLPQVKGNWYGTSGFIRPSYGQ